MFVIVAPPLHQLKVEKARNGKDRLNVLMKTLLLRRTKAEVGVDGKPIVDLPEKNIKTHLIELSEDEWKVYDKGLWCSTRLY